MNLVVFQHFNYVHLSAGDLLRAERTRDGSPYAELINTHICNGTIVPVEITCKLIENVDFCIVFLEMFSFFGFFQFSVFIFCQSIGIYCCAACSDFRCFQIPSLD